MGCITCTAKVVLSALALTAADNAPHLVMNAGAENNISTTAVVKNMQPVVTASTLNCIEMDASLICTVSVDKYLHVDKTVLWVTPEIYNEFKIKSNVSWVIS